MLSVLSGEEEANSESPSCLRFDSLMNKSRMVERFRLRMLKEAFVVFGVYIKININYTTTRKSGVSTLSSLSMDSMLEEERQKFLIESLLTLRLCDTATRMASKAKRKMCIQCD